MAQCNTAQITEGRRPAVIVEVRQMAGEIHVLVMYHMSTRALTNFTRGREAPEGNNQLSAQGTMR